MFRGNNTSTFGSNKTKNAMDLRTFILSDGNSINSHGFRISLEGMNLERFRKNPVMLFNHNTDQPIGRWVNLRLEDGRLLAEADIDEDDELGKRIARKIARGYLRGCSVGIHIRSIESGSGGTIATETELLEASIVAVPSDTNAIALYDEADQPTTLEAVKLKFNPKQKKQMNEQVELTDATMVALGLEADCTAEAIEQAVACKDRRIAELTAALEAHQRADLERMVDQAIAERKIGADERDTYLSLAEKDSHGVSLILSKMRGVEPVKAQLNTKAIASKYEGRTWDELDRAGLLASLRAEAPDMYQTLYNEKFTK